MLLGILSDTHDELIRTRNAVRELIEVGAEALVYCGDLASAPILEAISVLPCWFAFGNHDSDTEPALRLAAERSGATCLGWGGAFELEGTRYGVVHGHMDSDRKRVLALKPDVLFSGHSHIPSDDNFGSVRRINPGALHRTDQYTVAVFDTASGRVEFLRIE